MVDRVLGIIAVATTTLANTVLIEVAIDTTTTSVAAIRLDRPIRQLVRQSDIRFIQSLRYVLCHRFAAMLHKSIREEMLLPQSLQLYYKSC